MSHPSFSWRRFSRRFVAVCVSLLVTMGLLEVVIRFASTEGETLLVKDATVGQRYRPGFDGVRYIPESEREVRLRFNQDGFRGPEYSRAKPANVRRVAVLGDSFVAGIAVDEERILTSRLREKLERDAPSESWEVMNFGVSGSGTAQALLVWREFARHYCPDIVVVCFYNGNDLADNYAGLGTGHRPGFSIDDTGKLRFEPLNPARVSLSRWLSDHSHLYVWQRNRFRILRDRMREMTGVLAPGLQIFDTRRERHEDVAWRITEKLLGELQEEVHAAGADFLLVDIPAAEQIRADLWAALLKTVGPEQMSHYRRNQPEVVLEAMTRQSRIPFLPLLDTIQEACRTRDLYFMIDGHWNEAGHELASEEIAKFILQGKLRTPPPVFSIHAQ